MGEESKQKKVRDQPHVWIRYTATCIKLIHKNEENQINKLNQQIVVSWGYSSETVKPS